jgi:hypothetical protein
VVSYPTIKEQAVIKCNPLLKYIRILEVVILFTNVFTIAHLAKWIYEGGHFI